MGLLALPCTRNSLWLSVFGVPWDRALAVHIFLGYAWLAVVGLHVALWWTTFSQQKIFPHDALNVKLYYPFHGKFDPSKPPSGDNFTIALAEFAVFFVAAPLGLYPIVTFQYSSTTLYQVSYHIW